MSGCFNMLVFSVTCWKQFSLSHLFENVRYMFHGWLHIQYIYICSLDGSFDVKFRYFFNWSLSMCWHIIFFSVNEYLPSWTSLLLKGNCGFYILWSLLVLPCYNQSNILSKTEAVYINGGKNEEKHYHAPIFSMLVKVFCPWPYRRSLVSTFCLFNFGIIIM